MFVVEQQLYEKIRQQVLQSSLPDGYSKIILGKQGESEILFEDLDQMGYISLCLVIEKIPHFIFEKKNGNYQLTFCGKTFEKEENLSTHQILFYQKRLVLDSDMEKVKAECAALFQMLRNA